MAVDLISVQVVAVFVISGFVALNHWQLGDYYLGLLFNLAAFATCALFLVGCLIKNHCTRYLTSQMIDDMVVNWLLYNHVSAWVGCDCLSCTCWRYEFV